MWFKSVERVNVKFDLWMLILIIRMQKNYNPNAEELHVTSDEVPFICYTCFGLIIELDDLLNLRTFSCLMMFGGTPIMF